MIEPSYHPTGYMRRSGVRDVSSGGGDGRWLAWFVYMCVCVWVARGGVGVIVVIAVDSNGRVQVVVVRQWWWWDVTL